MNCYELKWNKIASICVCWYTYKVFTFRSCIRHSARPANPTWVPLTSQHTDQGDKPRCRSVRQSELFRVQWTMWLLCQSAGLESGDRESIHHFPLPATPKPKIFLPQLKWGMVPGRLLGIPLMEAASSYRNLWFRKLQGWAALAVPPVPHA